MALFHAPAWTADWLNAWLAAIGVTVLLDEVSLRWEASNPPHAVFEVPDDREFCELVVAALPTMDELGSYALARRGPDGVDFKQAVGIDVFSRRAKWARALGDFTFAIAVTDAAPAEDGRLPSSPFNPPMPKGITLWQRLVSCVESILDDDDSEALVRRSMTVSGVRVQQNGLGFDYRRIPLPTDPNRDVWVDPVVEGLAFYGLSLLPIRGDGRHARVRGWQSQDGRAGLRKSEAGAFRWPVWGESLALPGIDGYLDRFWGAEHTPDALAVFGAVPYESKGSSDMTRGFASRRAR